ncbi:hypothetical protein Cgig2_015740 [Carnegiea gigantea]|uniref:Uncharacterized protein n=1 Tax=Carnegiea gigantea TaxID=171969 RepID=A0A9Q1Q3R3_9CARY|nr:hypothetical protein Cgig2_015740 [Carnegiea gigantea]
MRITTGAYYPLNKGHYLSRPPSKRIESQTQDKKVQRCSKYDEVGHTRHTCRNPREDFDASYEGDVVQIEDIFDASYATQSAQNRYVTLSYKTHGTHQCIAILELHTCFHDRSSPTVGSESVVCDMVNCPLPTKNVNPAIGVVVDIASLSNSLRELTISSSIRSAQCALRTA